MSAGDVLVQMAEEQRQDAAEGVCGAIAICESARMELVIVPNAKAEWGIYVLVDCPS